MQDKKTKMTVFFIFFAVFIAIYANENDSTSDEVSALGNANLD